LLKKLIIIIVISLIPSLAWGQNFDAATREMDRDVRGEMEKKLLPKPKAPAIKEKVKTPEEKKGPKFFVKEIVLEGCESIPPEHFTPLVEKYENKEVYLSELEILAKEIQREYLRKMIIASCYIPPQDASKGTAILRVTEARMGTLTINKTKWFDEDTYKFYWTLKKGDVIRYDKMRRSLLLMNENPDRDVSANLKAGEEPGTTDIIIDAKTRFPIHPTFSFDNEGVRSTGKDRITFGGRDNNVLFVDDMLLAGYTYGKDFSGVYFYHSIPITNCGTRVMWGLNDSRSKPKKEFESFGIKSHVQNWSFFAYQDLYYKAEYLGEFSIGLDIKDKGTKYNLGTLNRDRLRILRVGASIMTRFFGGMTYLNPQVSQGIHFLGARRKSELSSRKADCIFTKFNLSLRHKRSLPFNFQTNLTFKTQVASETLTPQEEYFLGGIDSVRGYPSGDFLADNAFQANVELLTHFFFIPEDWKLPFQDKTIKENVTGLAFFDYGYGEKHGRLGNEQKKVTFASFGTGLRIRVYDRMLLRLEWGFPVAERPLTETADSRFHLSLNIEL